MYIFSSGGKSLITLAKRGREKGRTSRGRDAKRRNKPAYQLWILNYGGDLVIRGLDTIVLALCSTGFLLRYHNRRARADFLKRLISGAKRLNGSLVFLVNVPALSLTFLYFSPCENSGIRAISIGQRLSERV